MSQNGLICWACEIGILKETFDEPQEIYGARLWYDLCDYCGNETADLEQTKKNRWEYLAAKGLHS